MFSLVSKMGWTIIVPIEIITIVCAMVICAMDFLPEILSKIIPNTIIINSSQANLMLSPWIVFYQK